MRKAAVAPGEARLPITAAQADMLRTLDATMREARDRFAVAVGAVLAGHGIAQAEVVGLDGTALLVRKVVRASGNGRR